MTFCSQCVNYRKSSPVHGFCAAHRLRYSHQSTADGCRDGFVPPDGLWWKLRDSGIWELYWGNRILGAIVKRAYLEGFFTTYPPTRVSDMRDCATALVARVKEKAK